MTFDSKAYNKAYYLKNRDKISLYKKQYYFKNRDRILKKWHESKYEVRQNKLARLKRARLSLQKKAELIERLERELAHTPVTL